MLMLTMISMLVIRSISMLMIITIIIITHRRSLPGAALQPLGVLSNAYYGCAATGCLHAHVLVRFGRLLVASAAAYARHQVVGSSAPSAAIGMHKQ